MTPDVSAIIPTHNRRQLLALTLRTVLAQRGISLETIVVDDGSTDDTASLVQAIGDRGLRLIRHERPLGVSAARTRGAQEASARWLAFCDDDDLWAPGKLAAQVAAAAAAKRRWAYGGAVRIDRALRLMSAAIPPSPERLVARLPRWNLMPGGASNVIVERSLFEEAGGWDPALINLADWDLWRRLSKGGLPACVTEPLVGYRIHAGNASRDTGLILREARLLQQRHDIDPDFGELHHYLAWVHLRAGQRAEAMSHLARAAAAGQFRAVCGTLGALARGRIRRAAGWHAPPRPPEEQRWIDAAESWLAPLRGA